MNQVRRQHFSSSEAVWIGIDLGTQSVRALAVTERGEVVANSSHRLVSRRSGREHTQDAMSWWDAVTRCCLGIVGVVEPSAIQGLAIDATSGTILLTDEHLDPVSDGLMYDDGRAAIEAVEVSEAGATLWAELGYRLQPSWALPKLLWLMRNIQRARLQGVHLTHQNDFIHQQLAGRRVSTDWSHSLKTGYDLVRQRWPFEIFDALGLESSLFPDVVSPGSVIAHVCRKAASTTGLPPGLPIIAGMTDGCAAQIASGAISIGSWNSVLGTTLVLKGVTAGRITDPLGVVYSHRSPNERWLPGGASSTGAGILAKKYPGADLDLLSVQADSRGATSVVTYPLISRGERFPFYAPAAEEFSIGSPGDSVEAFRAILQGVAFIERLSFDYLEMLDAPLTGIFAISGGAVRSQFWNGLRATILERPLTIARVTEGAFGMAVLAASHLSSLDEVAGRMIRPGTVVEPSESFAAIYGETYRLLLNALEDRGWLPREMAAFSLAKMGRPSGGGR